MIYDDPFLAIEQRRAHGLGAEINFPDA